MSTDKTRAHYEAMAAEAKQSSPAKCDTCKFMGRMYWDNGVRQEHHCEKGSYRRADVMKPTGDFANDFMENFRMFFDASAGQHACKYYEDRGPIDPSDLAMLKQLEASKGFGDFKFFSDENRRCHGMSGMYTREDGFAGTRGEIRRWRLTNLGKAIAALARIGSTP